MRLFKNIKQTTDTENSVTTIAKGCGLLGEITTLEGYFYIEGFVDGTIKSQHNISIGIEGHVSGNVQARKITVNGELEGNIQCEHMHIMKNGLVNAELTCDQFTIETGGRFTGTSRQNEAIKDNITPIEDMK